MIKLNIIPENIKKEIKSNYVFNVIKKSLYITIILFSVAGIFLMISEFILLSTLAKEINGTTLDFKGTASASQSKVTDINNKLLLLDDIQNDFTRWSKLFKIISDKTPDGIVFNTIKVDKSVPSISFKGVANERDQLLTFKENIESSDIFENIDFPVQNLLQKENINFEIMSKIKIDEIN